MKPKVIVLFILLIATSGFWFIKQHVNINAQGAAVALAAQVPKPSLTLQNGINPKSVKGSIKVTFNSKYPLRIVEIEKRKAGSITWTTIGRIENIATTSVVFSDTAIVSGIVYMYQIRATYLAPDKSVFTTPWSEIKTITIPK